MPSKEKIIEIKSILKQRGEPTREQRAYARIEEEMLDLMYAKAAPADEVRYSYLRTLDRYIGKNAFEDLRNQKMHAVDYAA